MLRLKGQVFSLIVVACSVCVLLSAITIGTVMFIASLEDQHVPPPLEWHVLMTQRNAEITAIEMDQTLAYIESCQCADHWVSVLESVSRRKGLPAGEMLRICG